MVLSSWPIATARVHPVHLDECRSARRAAADPPTKPSDLDVESACIWLRHVVVVLMLFINRSDLWALQEPESNIGIQHETVSDVYWCCTPIWSYAGCTSHSWTDWHHIPQKWLWWTYQYVTLICYEQSLLCLGHDLLVWPAFSLDFIWASSGDTIIQALMLLVLLHVHNAI